MNIILFIMFIISSIIVGINGNPYLLYLSYSISFLTNLIKYKKTKNDTYLLIILLLSVIIPNNYIIIGVNILLYFIRIFDKKNEVLNKKKSLLLNFLFILLIVVNVVLCEKRYLNLLFSFLYYLPLFISKKALNLKNINFDILVINIKNIMICQSIAILTNFIFNFKTIIGLKDGDWVTGTFGNKQGNIFFFYCIFSLIILLYYYHQKKDIKCIPFIILCVFLAVLTGSIMLIIALFLALCIYYIFMSKNNLKKRISSILFLTIGVTMFVIITPTWVTHNTNIMINDIDNISSYIKKVIGYKRVFIDIPNNDKQFFLIGNGIGQYSSRSALTCTGKYINKYNKLFKISMSNYTYIYIYPDLNKPTKYAVSTKDTQYSSIISVMGELGIIGILFLIYYFIRILISSNNYAKVFVIVFIIACFIDNYLEFAKVVCMLYFLLNYFKTEKE